MTADEVAKGKPNPETYLKGAELLGVAPQKCLVFEDAPPGIESAHAAGMAAIALSTTYPLADLKHADAWIKDFSQVKARCLARDGEGDLEIAVGEQEVGR